MSATPIKTNIYVDGFNFYYGCYKDISDPIVAQYAKTSPHKWIDLRALAQAILPNDQIHRVHLFSASPFDTATNGAQSLRQETWFRALRAHSNVKITLGTHQERSKFGRLLTPIQCQARPSCLPLLLNVMTREEKGSDVNLAAWLLKDAFLNDFERALVISNDSDLENAVRIAKIDARKDIVVVSPRASVVKALRKAASRSLTLDKQLLPMCQLPDPTPVRGGSVSKPVGW